MKKSLREILPVPRKYQNDLPKYGQKAKLKIISQLPEVNDLNSLTIWGKSNVVPAWFYLLSDDELFTHFINHPLAASTIKNCESEFKKKSEMGEYPSIDKSVPQFQIHFVDNIFNYPLFFNYDVNKLKQLLEITEYPVSYDLIKYKSYEPLYVLDIVKSKILEFDEDKIVKSLNSFEPRIIKEKEDLTISSLGFLGILPSFIESLMSKENKEDFLKYTLAINEFIKLGAKTHYSVLKEMKNNNEIVFQILPLSMVDLMKIKNPQFHDFYCSYTLQQKLEKDLIKKETNKVRNKI